MWLQFMGLFTYNSCLCQTLVFLRDLSRDHLNFGSLRDYTSTIPVEPHCIPLHFLLHPPSCNGTFPCHNNPLQFQLKGAAQTCWQPTNDRTFCAHRSLKRFYFRFQRSAADYDIHSSLSVTKPPDYVQFNGFVHPSLSIWTLAPLHPTNATNSAHRSVKFTKHAHLFVAKRALINVFICS